MQLWSSLSALFLDRPRVYASTLYLRRLLKAGHEVELFYAGDRMWPGTGHGSRFVVRPRGAAPVRPGEIIVAEVEGIPELCRVRALTPQGLLTVADADPSGPVALKPEAVLGRIDDRPSRLAVLRPLRVLRRVAMDVREASRGSLPPETDAAETIRKKYDAQATAYRSSPAVDLSVSLAERVRATVPPAGRILVAGCGTGRECFGLVARGWSAIGVDYSGAMIAAAHQEAAQRGLQPEFLQADLRDLQLAAGSLAAILFTFDVYSFIPNRDERVAVLRRMSRWLQEGGVIFLSARRAHGMYSRMLLSLQWLVAPTRGDGEWGRSHTRWIDNQGAVRRAFVRHFRDRDLRLETSAAGLSMGPWRDGHAVLRPADSAPGE
jgi:SAM-dependent methyltransferase